MCLREDMQDQTIKEFKEQEHRKLDVDDLTIFNHKRVNAQIDTVLPDMKKQGKAIYAKKTMPQLHSLVQQTYHRMARDLDWLEQKT